jgi:bacterioferritin-associated ferredoxin
MWICLCEAVTSGTIRQVIDGGARNLADIERACAAGSVCGRCKRNILALIDEHRAADDGSEQRGRGADGGER